LQKNNVDHELVDHRKTFTGYDTSQTLGAKAATVVKGLLIKADQEIHLVLLQADKMLDLKKLAKLLKAKKITILKEKEMMKVLKLKKPGALHSFGSLYKFPLVVDSGLAKLKEALFPSDSFNHHLKLKVKDFLGLEEPKATGLFSVVKKFKTPKAKKATIKKATAKKKK